MTEVDRLFDPEIVECPHAYYAELRELDPVHRVAGTDAFVVCRADLIKEVVGDPGRFTSTTGEFTKTAEAQMSELQKSFASLVDSSLKNAPAGSEQAVTLVRSAMTAANNAYESVHKAAKQAADIAEANFTAVTNTAVKASQAAAKSAKRAA